MQEVLCTTFLEFVKFCYLTFGRRFFKFRRVKLAAELLSATKSRVLKLETNPFGSELLIIDGKSNSVACWRWWGSSLALLTLRSAEFFGTHVWRDGKFFETFSNPVFQKTTKKMHLGGGQNNLIIWISHKLVSEIQAQEQRSTAPDGGRRPSADWLLVVLASPPPS